MLDNVAMNHAVVAQAECCVLTAATTLFPGAALHRSHDDSASTVYGCPGTMSYYRSLSLMNYYSSHGHPQHHGGGCGCDDGYGYDHSSGSLRPHDRHWRCGFGCDFCFEEGPC